MPWHMETAKSECPKTGEICNLRVKVTTHPYLKDFRRFEASDCIDVHNCKYSRRDGCPVSDTLFENN